VLKSFKGLFKFVSLFEDIKPKDMDGIEKLDKAIATIPSVDVFIRALDENISNAKKLIEKVKALNVESFKRYEAEYIKKLREEKKPFRQYIEGWRIGKLVMKIKPELAKIKFLYNEQVLIDLTCVNSKEDFISLEAKANDMLAAQLIPEAMLIDVFFEAFIQAKNHLKDKDILSVSLHAFYKEVRIALIRKLLEKNSAIKIDKYLEFPLWAFLYNLDVYRSLGHKIPENKRLGLQTGSQQESRKGLVVNGLDPYDDYKVMCYINLSHGGLDK